MTKILIVDDEILICDVLKQIVELEGYEACCAFNGKQALQMLGEYVPDLVITDLLMPEKDGLELITAIRKVGIDTKIMAISGGSTNISKTAQLKVAQLMGADMCLTKPLDAQQFIGSVNALIQ